jgi:hypothetical protein
VANGHEPGESRTGGVLGGLHKEGRDGPRCGVI